jgi:hypothetical protein
VFSLLALVLFLFVHFVSASSTFHHFIHQDADEADHQCAATVLTHGQVDLAPQDVAVFRPVLTQDESPSPTGPLIVAIEYRLPAERAPPLLLA